MATHLAGESCSYAEARARNLIAKRLTGPQRELLVEVWSYKLTKPLGNRGASMTVLQAYALVTDNEGVGNDVGRWCCTLRGCMVARRITGQ